MKRLKLIVEKRTVVGKKVKKLRKEGFLPANIYGKDIKSLAVQVRLEEFDKVYKEAGETGLVDVEVDSETRPSLIHNVQLDYLTQLPVHADFYQVNLKEKVKTMVPLVLTGEAKAVSEKIGIVLQPLAEIEVEALPTDLPENIEVNITHLAAVNEQLNVSDLKIPAGVTILTDSSQVVVKIGELISKEAQEQAAAEAAAAEAAKAEQIAAEGAEKGSQAPAQGAAPVESTASDAAAAKRIETAKTEGSPLRQGSEGQAKSEEQPHKQAKEKAPKEKK